MRDRQHEKLALKKGDIIKTSLSDATVVLEVNGKDALLFSGNQYCLAKDIMKKAKSEKFSWGHGTYFKDMPSSVMNGKLDFEETVQTINYMIETNYEHFIKALVSLEKDITDMDLLAKLYDRYMNADFNLLNESFDALVYDIEHQNSVDDKVISVSRTKADKQSQSSTLDAKSDINASSWLNDIRSNESRKELKLDSHLNKLKTGNSQAL